MSDTLELVSSKPSTKSALQIEGYRLAIIGCGPRGLYCLESLARTLASTTLYQQIEILLFDPSPNLGAGNVYDPRQPHYLRMNFAANHIDAWPPGREYSVDELSFVDWLADKGRRLTASNVYLPRATVGEYLECCWKTVLSRLQQVASVTIHHEKVERISPLSHQWEIQSGTGTYKVDEVLLTLGHERWRTPQGHGSTNRAIGSPVFPPDSQLAEEMIPRNSVVAVKGFGLTWIDASLALTEGRGGVFIPREQGWKYHPSGEEPRKIVPFSRTGRPMLAKPNSAKFKAPKCLEEVWAEGCKQLMGLRSPVTRDVFRRQLKPIIFAAAEITLSKCVSRSRVMRNVDENPATWYLSWTSKHSQPRETHDLLKESYLVAEGVQRPSCAWALGEAWRQLYPALVKLVSYGGLARDAWTDFQLLAIEMERLAFGPPAENVARILALVDAGIIDFGFINSVAKVTADGKPQLVSSGVECEPDFLVNAVIPGPRDFCPSGPLTELLHARHVQQLYGELGIEVDPTGRAVVNNPTTTAAISVIGRPTEGCVLGNDTLSRTLHQQPERWAEAVIKRLQAHAYQFRGQQTQ